MTENRNAEEAANELIDQGIAIGRRARQAEINALKSWIRAAKAEIDNNYGSGIEYLEQALRDE